MSRSDPPRSRIAARVRESDAARGLAAPPRRTLRRRLGIRLAAWMRWLHIYLSMFGLAAVLFFSVTGLTLNHPAWFEGAERTAQAEGRLDARWLRRGGSPASDADPERQVAKLEVVEQLRRAHGLRGALTEFRVDEDECLVAFKGPGYAADAFIDRTTGHYTLTETAHGFVAIINDLHKGRDTGPAWSWVIDVAAALTAIIALTGLVLLFYLKIRRVRGLVVVAFGAAVVAAFYLLGVP